MKNYILALGLAALTMASCSDFLDKEPSTALPVDGAITSTEDLLYALNGVSYRFTDDRMSYASEFGIYADLLTNDYKVIKGNNQSEPISKYSITRFDDFPAIAFYTFYKALAEDNKALVESQKLEATDEVKNLQGQLYAWRGLMHFDLARLFANIPSTVADVNAPNSGIPVSNQVFEPEYLPTRTTLAQTYAQVIADLTKGYEMMDEYNGAGYMNKWAALALRARAYLYMGDFENAKTDAMNVIENCGQDLLSIDNYVKAWTMEDADETLFELAQNDNYNPQRYAAGYYCDAAGYAENAFNPDGKLFQYLSTHPEDVRSGLIKDQTSDGTAPGFYPGKFPGRQGSNPLYVNNPKIVRLSEMYLIAAEALVNQNHGDQAAKYINDLRRERIVGYTDVNEVTIDEVIDEYVREFFCENQSAFAYWRNKKSVTNQLNQEVKYNDNRVIFPIPQREREFNPGLAQNPGY